MSLSRALLLALSLVTLSTSACVVRAAYPGVPADAEIIAEAPPAPRTEVIAVAPSANHVWIAGHWGWRGRWVWEPGFWELTRPGHVWVAGHWVRHRDGWVWLGGHWNRL